jgi:hypothetical protein
MSRSQISQELLMDAVTIAINDTHYTESRRFHDCIGDAALLITLASAGAATTTITQQCSIDNVTWYDPKSTAGAALGAIITAVAVASTPIYVVFTPIIAPYVRFVVHVDTAIGIVTAKLSYRLEV